MALYKYVKAQPAKPRKQYWPDMMFRISINVPSISFPTFPAFPAFRQRPVNLAPAYEPVSIRYISASIGMIGFFLIVWVAYPILSFEIMSRTKYSNVVQPIPPTSQTLGWEQVTKIADAQGSVLSSSTGSSRVNSWLPRKQEQEDASTGRTYYLSIPELRIKDARVIIGGSDLDTSLIHYGGTGLPGDYGNSVIFGHSILPQFYDPANYKTIFSLLPKLDKGDDIYLKYDGISYRYKIFSLRVTTPDDISVLEQRYDASYVTLVTCVPPGTYWKRLEIRARLEPAA